MVKCLTGSKYTMRCTIMRQVGDLEDVSIPGDELPSGEFVDQQDALTGEIVRVWRPTFAVPDNPDTPDVDESVVDRVNCLARGVNYKSARDEQFGENYRALDSVNLWVPSGVSITRRDRVTNISTKDGTLLWTDESSSSTPRAMVFNVIGVTPVIDPFGKHLENYSVLERAEV